jgi:hypothetical protein
MDWFLANMEWIFSGVGVTIIFWIIRNIFGRKNKQSVTDANNINGGNSSSNNIDINISTVNRLGDHFVDSTSQSGKSLDDYKNVTRILFIDDDARFKVAKILVKSGWVHTSLIKDCQALDDKEVVAAEILFIDVQGVGVSLGFADEGLGLALAIKEKYPNKKIVIYSAETQGDRFHEALRKADSFLAKNADPYEFQKLVEEFTIGAE